MDDYLTKPVLIRDLDTMLQQFRQVGPGNGAEPDTRDTLQVSVKMA